MPRSPLSLLGSVLLVLGLAFVLGSPQRAAPPQAATGTTGAPATPPDTTAPDLYIPDASPTATPVAPIPDGYRVRIPRLGIDLPIAEGDLQRDAVRQQTPEGFAFHYPGTGVPGDPVNCYLYAHARTGMFLELWNARAGDEVIITTPHGQTLRYVVAQIHPRVTPQDTSWVRATPPGRLTLQTSTGPNPQDPRFVVVALPG